MSKMKCYIAVGGSSKMGRDVFSAITVVAHSSEEACGALVRDLNRTRPEADGWEHFGMKVEEITNLNFLETAADRFIELSRETGAATNA